MHREVVIKMVWSSLLLLLAAVGLVYLVPEYISMPQKLKNPYLSPRLWPTIILGITGLVALCIAGQGVLLAYNKHDDTTLNLYDVGKQALSGMACMGCMLLCLVCIPTLGMPVAVTLCMVLLLCIVGKKSSVVGCAVLMALPYALYLFFYHVADVAVPLGFLN